MITATQYFNGYSANTIGSLLESTGIGKTRSVSDLNNTFSDSILGSSFTQVAISTFGSQINQIYTKLNSIEDIDERNSAQDSLREILMNLVENQDEGELFSFVSTVNRVAETDVSAFQAIFGGGTDTNETYSSTSSLSSTQFVDYYGEVSNSDLSSDFNSAGLDIITGSGSSLEKQNAYNTLLETTSSILNADLTDDEYETVKTAFFSGLAESATVGEMKTFMDEFSIEKVVEASAESQAEDQVA